MSRTTCHVSISLDGFVAGPNQSLENPIGVGGKSLHEWHFEPLLDVDIPVRDNLLAPNGAYIMGRNMFGPIRGEWEEDWRGSWGDEPPYHAPVFVLTHHARADRKEGGTTFFFAGDAEVDIAGGASAGVRRLGRGGR